MELLCFLILVIVGIVAAVVVSNQRQPSRNDHIQIRSSSEIGYRSPTKPQAEILTVDMSLADAVLNGFEQSVGTNEQLREAATAIARAGGMPALEDRIALAASRHRDPSIPDVDWMRPWYSLIAVARQAIADGDLIMVARICILTYFWHSLEAQFTANRAGVRDVFVIGLRPPEAKLRREIFTIGVTHLSNLPADIKIPHGRDTVSVADALWGSAYAIRELALQEEITIDPEVLELAEEIIDSGIESE